MTADDLRAALHGYMKRDDPETVGNELTALEFARQSIEKIFFPLESEETASPLLTVTNGAAVLPPDFGKAMSVGRNLDYIAPRIWQHLIVDAPDNLGGSYSIYAGYVQVHPSILALSFVYNARPLPITGTGENWLSDFYGQVWLHAARAEQYRFIEDLDSQAATEQLWRGMVDEFTDSSERRRQSGGALRMRSR